VNIYKRHRSLPISLVTLSGFIIVLILVTEILKTYKYRISFCMPIDLIGVNRGFADRRMADKNHISYRLEFLYAYHWQCCTHRA
jgi:hypothetical protein